MSQVDFSSLPTEIYLYILTFLIDWELQGGAFKQSTAKSIASFQSINKNINTNSDLQVVFNKFWWKLFEINFGMASNQKLENLKSEIMESKLDLKRIILKSHYTKFKLWRLPKIYEMQWNTKDLIIVVLGRGGVGKSSITIRFIQHVFLTDYDPTIEDSYRTNGVVDDRYIQYDILDTAYSEYDSPMKEYYMHYASGFIVVCDITDRPTLVDAKQAVEYLVNSQNREVNDMAIVFALNKIDLLNDSQRKRAVDEFSSEIEAITKESLLTNWKLMECSAKECHNITEMFMDLARRRQCYDIIDDFTLLQNIAQENGRKSASHQRNKKNKCSLM